MKVLIIYHITFLFFSIPVTAGFYADDHAHKTPFVFSNSTDYFRSVVTGPWNASATWESSPDNITWSAATLTPTFAANTISIRNSNTVTINSNEDIDEVVIEMGGILTHNSNTLTIHDNAAGADVNIQAGGIFILASAANPPVFATAPATVNVSMGAMLRVSAGGMTGVGTGVNASNYIYQNASVLELTVVYSTNGVTFFPNVAANTIPVFRSATNLNVGSGGTTTFNGLFEALNSLNIDGTGTKIFRNGIIGTGNINGSTSGKFIINGTTASLGGTGLLTLPPTAGMDIGPTATVSMLSDKSVNGNIALLANALITLANFNLTMTGDVGGGSSTSHVVTNGSGKLVLNNITGTSRIFPIGANTTTINPMAIFNGAGLNYAARVEVGINPAIAVPLKAVNRTWFVTPNGGTPATVNTNFFYYAGEGNAGFNYTSNLELGQYTGVWNVIQTGLTPAGAYQVATTVSTFGHNIEAPLVLANLGAILAAYNSIDINYFTGAKQNGNHLLNWQVTCVSTPGATVEIERSIDGRNYNSIYSIFVTAVPCTRPFNYTDNQPAKGVNYYRLKIIDADGKVFYSSIVGLINATKGIDVMNIAPNPIVNGHFNVKISTAENAKIEFVITDMQGRVMQKQAAAMIAGFNTIPMNVRNLAAGTYQLFGNTVDGQTKVLRFVIQ